MPDNTVTVIGNATRAPELKFTPSGQALANFGMAVNRRWQNKQTQEWEESVSFFDVTCWAQLAQNVADSIDKGTRLIVSGRLEQRSWESPEGEKRSKVEIIADEVAPSLRWATADVSRNERSERSANSPTGTTVPARTSGQSLPADAEAGGYAGADEPF